MKEIGGYFGLELSRGKEYYPDAIKLNSARNCFKYILLAQKPSKVYVPYYIDKSMTEESLQNSGVKFEFYNIDEKFEIADSVNVKNEEKILYNNYFALKNEYVLKLVHIYGNKLIIDNTQAFFCKPVSGIDTLYSLGSKFFGAPGGGYLFTNVLLNTKFEQDVSYAGMTHLLGRIDKTAHEFFEHFQESKKRRCNQEIKIMSNLTQAILSSIDYETVKIIRERNFYYLHSYLQDINELQLNLSLIEGPMIYPLLIKKDALRQKLIENKIYVPTYWKEILDMEKASEWEKYLTNYLLPLPIDQRYEISDMKIIIDCIKQNI
jgi:hypothetical protein